MYSVARFINNSGKEKAMKWRLGLGVLLTAVLLAVSMIPVSAGSTVRAAGITPCDNPTVLFPPVTLGGNATKFSVGTELQVWLTVRLSDQGPILGGPVMIAETEVKTWAGWWKGVYYSDWRYYQADLPWDCPETLDLEGVVGGLLNVVEIKVDGATVGVGESWGQHGSSLLVDIEPPVILSEETPVFFRMKRSKSNTITIPRANK